MVSFDRTSDGFVVRASRDRIAVGLIILGTLIYFADILTSLERPFAGRDAGPAFYPYVITITILVFGAWILWKSDEVGELKFDYDILTRLFVFGVISMIYSIIIFLVGFFVSSILYALAVILLFNYPEYNLKKSIPVSVGITLLVWVIFELAFDVRLPAAPFI